MQILFRGARNMKRWIDRIQLLSWKELLITTRTRKGILIFVIIAGLGVVAQLLNRLGTTTPSTCSSVLFSGYLNFIQLLPFVLAIVLADVVSGEKERKTWNFYFTKPFSSGEILLSKLLVNYILIGIAIIMMWIGLYLFASTATSGCHISQAMYPLLVILAITFTIVSLEITISAFSKRIAVAVLLIIAGWIGLIILNLVVPIGRGFIAPWAANSYQTSVVNRFLGIQLYLTPFENLTAPPSSTEQSLAILLPLVQGMLLYIVAWITVRRSTGV